MLDSRPFAFRGAACLLATATTLVFLVISGCREGQPAISSSSTVGQQARHAELDALTVVTTEWDPRGNRLWLVSTDAAYLFDARSLRKLGRIQLDDWIYVSAPFACAPGMLIRESGAMLVSSNALPVIWELEPVHLAATRRPVQLVPDDGKDVGFTGLAQTMDGKVLFGTNGLGGLWRIDTEGWVAVAIRLDRPVPLGRCSVSIQEPNEVRGAVALCIHSDAEGVLVILDSQLRTGKVDGTCARSVARQRTSTDVPQGATHVEGGEASAVRR